MTFVTHLESAIDGTHLPHDVIQTVHKDRPLWVRYDLAAVRRATDPQQIAHRPPTLWRYHELLPLPEGAQPVTLGEGMSPLLPAPRLGKEIGLRDLWVKDESQLPTGSFKSRGLSMAVTMARHFGIKRLAIPTAGNAGGAMAAVALLRLAVFTGDQDLERHAVESLRSVRDLLSRAPASFSHWLGALDFYLSTPKEIVVIGPRDNPATQALLRVAYGRYLPNRAIAGADAPAAAHSGGADAPISNAASPLLAGRELVDGKPTAYVCESYACQLPVTEPGALTRQLGG